MRRSLAAALGTALLLAAAPASAGTGMFVGAASDDARALAPAVAKSRMDLTARAGFGAVRMSVVWTPGEQEVGGDDLVALDNATRAADADGVRLILSIYARSWTTAPLTSTARGQFARFAASIARAYPSIKDFVVGNEPNLNLFWMPQFGAGGVDLAARSYELLLAKTYDALKAVSADIDVIGGALAPRGQDKPGSARQTHSPTAFIADLGSAYRATKRRRPIMDTFAIHPYLTPSSLPPSFAHPHTTTIGIADYPKLVKLLTAAFRGTAQRGETLPIVYDEFGYQTQIPQSKRWIYNHLSAPSARDAIPEAQQAAYYKQAFALAACQPSVAGVLIFHVADERDARAWQSGVYYGNFTPKSSLAPVRAAALAAQAGTLASCRQDKTTSAASGIAFHGPSATDPATLAVDFSCALPCTYELRLIDATTSGVAAATEGKAVGDATATIATAGLADGTYQYALRIFKCGKPGTATTRFSRPFDVPAASDPVPLPPALDGSEPPLPTLQPTEPATS
ncbi:MAG TPA: hypothetical protein VI408_16715 [Gaiellaceae bacterium]